MRLDTILIADHAASTPDGKMYINGAGITRLNVPMLPFALPLFAVVARWKVEPEDVGSHSLLVRVVSPSGIDLLPSESVPVDVVENPTSVEGEERHLQMAMNFGGLPVLEEGVYTLSIEMDGEVQREVTLPVVAVAEHSVPTPNRAERRRQERAAKR